MKQILVIVLLVLSIRVASAQDVPVIKFEGLQKILESNDSEVVIVNFWATWCAPCVAELPIFDKFFSEKPEGISMYLISMDFVDKLSRVQAFVKRKNLHPPVLLLDDIDYNSWIDKVDASWSGAIPATLVINSKTGKRKFIGKELTEADLHQMVSDVKN